MTLAFVLFIGAPFLIVGWISAYQAADSMKQEVAKTTTQLVDQNHATLEKTLTSVNDRTIALLDNQFFSNAAQYAFWTNVESLSDIREADEILERWTSDGTEYTLYMKNKAGKQPVMDLTHKKRGFKYFEEQGAGLPETAADALQEGGRGTLRLTTPDTSATTVTFTRSILNPKAYEESIGLLAVAGLEVLLKKDMLSVELPQRSSLYLYNEQGELLMQVGSETSSLSLAELPEGAQHQKTGYAFGGEGGDNWLYAYSRRSPFNTTLIYKIPLESITGKQAQFQTALMIVTAVYLAFVLLFVLYLLRMLIRPLVKLVAITKIYEPGRPMDIGGDLLRRDEIGLLYGAFQKMTRRLDLSIEENYGMQLKQKENELSMLHSQITPHLLYNTLDSIYWYALDSGNTDVGEMVKDLSKLLRIGLSKGRTIITVEEEAEHVQAYSRLQMKRYPNTFDIVWDIDERLAACPTPKVILQPLVENAIFHGVSGMDGEGLIRVAIARSGDELLMTVEDNGFLPVDTDRLNRIVSGEDADRGYGIRNVHQRVRLHYGETYGLHYEQREGGGVRAVIRLPLQTTA